MLQRLALRKGHVMRATKIVWRRYFINMIVIKIMKPRVSEAYRHALQ